MKKYTVLAATGFFMVLFFQNCGKPPSTMDMEQAQAGIVSPAQNFNKYSASEFSVLSLWDFNHSRFLDLDRQSGRIVAYEQGGQVQGETFQLPPEKLSELERILDSAEVCEPIINPEDRQDQMCSMAYRYPYAILVEQGQEIRLGEKADSCDIPSDICGEKAKELQSWVSEVVNSFK